MAKNQKSYYFAQGAVGVWGTAAMRDDIVNFVNDGTVPQLNFKDMRGSLTYGLSIMNAGFQVMKTNQIGVQQASTDLYNLYSSLLDALNQLEQQNRPKLP